MDFAKLGTYISSVVSGVCGILVVTHNLGDALAQQIGSVVGILTGALAAIFAANSAPQK